MKKTLTFVMSIVLMFANIGCRYDDSEVKQRLDALEEKTGSNLDNQLAAIRASIASLESVDKEVKSLIASLDDGLNTLNEKETQLSRSIADLKDSLDNAWNENRNWIEVTFSTITMYENLLVEMESIRMALNERCSDLDSKIDSSIVDIKAWVNISLKSYYTSTEVDQKLDELKGQLNSLNDRLILLEDKFSKLVAELAKKLDIVFSDQDVSCFPADVVDIEYLIKNGGENSAVYCMANDGWESIVIRETDSTGVIRVTAPSPICNTSILVFVTDGMDKTAIRALNFIAGSMILSTDVLMADADGDTLIVDVKTDLQYTVQVVESIDWLHYKSVVTRSIMRDEAIILTVDENNTQSVKTGLVNLVNSNGQIIKTITVRQSANVMQSNEIWYKTSDNQIIDLLKPYAFGANIVSNSYGKKGVISFDGPVTRIGSEAFNNCTTLTEISIPDGPVSIGMEAFQGCSNLKIIAIPNSVKIIEERAFYGAFNDASVLLPEFLETIKERAFYGTGLLKITMPNTITTIERYAFEGTSLKEIDIPNSIQYLNEGVFRYSGLESIVIPNSVQKLGSGVFFHCSNLERVILPESIMFISDYCFWHCIKIESIVLPKNVSCIGTNAFDECVSLKEITFNSTVHFIKDALFDAGASSYGEVFESCNKLEVINYFGYPDVFERNRVFGKVHIEGITLHVPKGCAEIYSSAFEWRYFNKIKEDMEMGWYSLSFLS